MIFFGGEQSVLCSFYRSIQCAITWVLAAFNPISKSQCTSNRRNAKIKYGSQKNSYMIDKLSILCKFCKVKEILHETIMDYCWNNWQVSSFSVDACHLEKNACSVWWTYEMLPCFLTLKACFELETEIWHLSRLNIFLLMCMIFGTKWINSLSNVGVKRKKKDWIRVVKETL